MTQIGQNTSNYNTYPVQKNSTQASQRPIIIPDYYVEQSSRMDDIKESLKKNLIYTIVIKGFLGEFIEHPLSSFGTWLGLSFLLDKYTASIGGKYETSLLGRAARLGDKIEESKFIKSKPMQKILNGIGVVKKQGGKAVQGNSVLKAMKETPSKPEWGFVKGEMMTQKQRVVEDFIHITNKLHLTDEGQIKLKSLALNSKEKDALKKFFKVKNLSAIPDELAANHVILSRLGVPKDEIVKILSTGMEASNVLTKKAVLESMGLTPEKLKLIGEDEFGKYADDVLKVTKKVGNKIRICEGHISLLGPLSRPFERIIGCDQIYNRLHSIGAGAKTGTGRFLSKAIQMFHRGITFGGGKTGVLLFIAPAAVVAAINVNKAENNQKVGTGVSSLVNSISWVFTFPLALVMMHTLGGAQYAGMGKDKVTKYRKIINDFNAKNKNGEFRTKDQYKIAKEQAKKKLDTLYKVKGQNIFTRSIRKLARWMTVDLERFNVYNTGNIVTKNLSKIRNFPRNAFGVPLRLIIWGGLSIGVLDTLINKCIKVIFGESYDAAKEEEIKEAKKEEKKVLKKDLQKVLYDTQKRKVLGQVNSQQSQTKSQVNSLAHRGLPQQNNQINQNNQNFVVGQQYHYLPQQTPVQTPKQENKEIDNYTYIPSQENIIPTTKGSSKTDNYTYIPSQNSTIKPDKNKSDATNTRSYIPSQAVANIQKTWDNSGLESALARADRAEKNAMKILAGDFEGM